MSLSLRDLVRDTGTIPLGWAGASEEMNYLNWGDAMSPVMVALLTGAAIERVPFRSERPRLAAVGTVAHGFSGGEVWFWGSGCSPTLNPAAPPSVQRPYRIPENTRLHVAATRGPATAALLGAGEADVPFGDPVWLLPRFYRPAVEKTHELGVILHLSELADRESEAHPRADLAAYRLDGGAGGVRLINTVTEISADALRRWVDEVLACKRIVSTSLHGMVVAEAYGIPCLPLVRIGKPGPRMVDLTRKSAVDPRFLDLYRGLGQTRMPAYDRSPARPMDWEEVIRTIDARWAPKTLDEDRLMAALPVDVAPLAAPAGGGSVFDHPAIQAIRFQHDVRALGRIERRGARRWRRQVRAGKGAPPSLFDRIRRLAESFIKR